MNITTKTTMTDTEIARWDDRAHAAWQEIGDLEARLRDANARYEHASAMADGNCPHESAVGEELPGAADWRIVQYVCDDCGCIASRRADRWVPTGRVALGRPTFHHEEVDLPLPA